MAPPTTHMTCVGSPPQRVAPRSSWVHSTRSLSQRSTLPQHRATDHAPPGDYMCCGENFNARKTSGCVHVMTLGVCSRHRHTAVRQTTTHHYITYTPYLDRSATRDIFIQQVLDNHTDNLRFVVGMTITTPAAETLVQPAQARARRRSVRWTCAA